MTFKRIAIAAFVISAFGAYAGNDKSAYQKQTDNFGPRAATQDLAPTASGVNDKSTVRAAQQQLKDKGYDIAVDGAWGPNTQTALEEFQQKQGLPASGSLDAQTLAALGVGNNGNGSAQGGIGAGAGASTHGGTASQHSGASASTANGGSDAAFSNESKMERDAQRNASPAPGTTTGPQHGMTLEKRADGRANPTSNQSKAY